jgi:hypothetical protein
VRHSVAAWTLNAHDFLIPWAGLVLTLVVLVLVPMAFFQRTRPITAFGFLVASWVIGVMPWLAGVSLTLRAFGWLGFVLGMMFVGLGVIPLGIFVAFFLAKNATALGVGMIAEVVVTILLRVGGAAVTQKYDRTKAERPLPAEASAT